MQLREHTQCAADFFEKAMRQYDEVRAMYRYGPDFEYVLRVLVDDVASAEQLIREVVMNIPTVIVLRSIK
ncbi:Lrp/AsnC ligand binding domain-containing protein [Pseudomonas sp. NPDC089918]|uniref:Lrp/AsnC ligand binding domain-containing protein n=1 Tax=Pseudomonas sp. NPDC089918 TaxID=3390654 RepID=UPI003CFCE527